MRSFSSSLLLLLWIFSFSCHIYMMNFPFLSFILSYGFFFRCSSSMEFSIICHPLCIYIWVTCNFFVQLIFWSILTLNPVPLDRFSNIFLYSDPVVFAHYHGEFQLSSSSPDRVISLESWKKPFFWWVIVVKIGILKNGRTKKKK
jgi:hypothetical protein